jgi:DNA gyrase subunit A
MITDAGKTIRLPVGGDKPIRIVSRGSQGVIVLDTAEGERVVSVERISEPEETEDDEGPEETAAEE